MPDLQRTVDEVRFRIQSGDCELNDELKRLAGDYAVLCHEANLRLRRCGEFLRQGQRSGAIHLAEAAPNLLEAFATLDFPERTEWDEFVRLNPEYQMPESQLPEVFAFCTVHGCDLVERVIFEVADPALARDPQFLKAEATQFPYAHGEEIDAEWKRPIWWCPECQQARDEWMADNKCIPPPSQDPAPK